MSKLVTVFERKLTHQIDLDFLTGKFTEVSGPGGTVKIDEDNSLANFKLGAGVRYNF